MARRTPPRRTLHHTRRLVGAAVAVLVVVTAGLGGIAWRLAQGPLEVSLLARRIEVEVNSALAGNDPGRPGGAPQLVIGSAAIAWEGWHSGAAAPLDIRLTGVRLLDQDGASRLELPDAAATLSVRALLRGTLAPATIELHRPVLRVVRDAAGGFDLALGPPPADAPGPGEVVPGGNGSDRAETPETTAPDVASADVAGADLGDALLDRLADMMQPVSDGANHAALRRIRLTGGELIVVDRMMGRSWSLADARIDIRRAATGGLAAEGDATFRTIGAAVPVRLTGTAAGSRPSPRSAPPVAPAPGIGPDRAPMRLTLGIALPALRPSQLAELWPGLAPLGVLDAAVSLAATAEFDAAAGPQLLQARLAATAGTLDFGDGQRLPFAGIEARLEGSGRSLRLTEARLALPSGPALTATGEAALRDGAWQVALDLRAGPVQAADLPRLWPPELAGASRGAVLRALPAGLLQDARLRLELTTPETPDRVALTSARVTLRAAGAVLDLGRHPGQDRRVATEAIELAASLTPQEVRLDRLVVGLPAPTGGAAGPGRPAPRPASAPTSPAAGFTAEVRAAAPAGRPPMAGPVITASGEAQWRDGLWRGNLALGLDAVRAADLAGYWPRGIGNGYEREWITRNVTAGTLRNGRWRIEAEAPAALDALRVTALAGSAEVRDATVHWLRPVPPLQGGAATAEFSLTGVVIRASAGRQQIPDERPGDGRPGGGDGRPGGLELRDATVRFLDLDQSPGNVEMTLQMAGPLADAVAVLRHPRLKLFDRRKLELSVAAGQAEARLAVGFPLLNDLPLEALRLRATARITEARLPGALLKQEVDRGNFDLTVDTDTLKLTGQALLVGAPVRLAVDMDFRGGPATQVIERATLTGRPEARQLVAFGLDVGGLAEGPVNVDARYERRRNGQGQVMVRGDLRDARLAVEPLRWAKPPGQPATAEGLLRLHSDTLTTMEGFRLEAPEVALRGRATFGLEARLERFELAGSRFAGSQLTGEVRRPVEAGGPWETTLRGPVLDLQRVLGPAPEGVAPPMPQAEAKPPLALDLTFDRVTFGEVRDLHGVRARLRTDARGLVREARATGRTGDAAGPRGGGPPGAPASGPAGGFEFSLLPRGQERALRLVAEDGGALLRSLDLVRSIRGGRLTVTGSYAELRPGAALRGTAELDGFSLRDAPAIGKLLQAMTLYGVVEAMQGGSGLVFSRMVAPFVLTPEALVLEDARAFSASLGLTAKGRLFRDRPMLDIEGTIVPAYVFNTLLGRIPLLGRLFSPEAGGGLFAATYRVRGPIADPVVTVNPLAALTPGFLRGIFGLGQGSGQGAGQGGQQPEAVPP